MIKSSIEKLAHEIGYDIGAADDTVQADLINGFCEGVYNRTLNKNNLEKQLCYVSDKLTPKAKIVLELLVDFLKLNHVIV